MAALEWDKTGTKQYELGVSKGVLYKLENKVWKGYAWNGLISVTESPEGADETELWADNIKYGSLRSAEKFGGSIEAYTYPEEFEGCDGMQRPATGITIGQQTREKFCLCYRTEIGNDTDPEAGYRLHIVYNATCSPSEKQYETVNDNPDAITFSWDFDTVPENVGKIGNKEYKPTSLITIDSTDFTENSKANLEALEAILYGGNSADATLPLPAAVISVISTGSLPA